MMKSDGVRLEFTEDAVLEIADVASQVNGSGQDIGARRLQTVLATLLESWLFDIPDGFAGSSLEVDAHLVRERLQDVLRDEDVRQYIL
jgi:ATP-dependent HslUV protease ATP-binding subunit HslU